MSVRDTQARLATPGEEVIVPADAGQLACLAAIDDADYIIQDEVVLKSGVPEDASLSYDLFKDYDSSEKLAAVLYGSRPNVVLVGEMTDMTKSKMQLRDCLLICPCWAALLLSCLNLSAMMMTSHRFSIGHSLSTLICLSVATSCKWRTGPSCTYAHMVDLMSGLQAAQEIPGTYHRPQRTSSCGL